MEAKQWWLTIDALSILGTLSPLPMHPKKLLPKFHPNDDILLENHVKKFMIYMNMMNVQHEDVTCMLFYLH